MSADIVIQMQFHVLKSMTVQKIFLLKMVYVIDVLLGARAVLAILSVLSVMLV